MRPFASLLLASLLFMGFERPSECHEGHCHGSEICGGTWKDYKETRSHLGPEGGSESKGDACEAALDELDEKVAVEAHERCPEKHPCGSCPDACSGCKQERPSGRIVDRSAASTTARARDDGSYECSVSAEIAFRCRCGSCLPN